jgi:lysophospholipase L1-like esterase
MPTWLSSLILLIVTLMICLLVGEGVARLVLADSMILFPRYHTDADYGEFTIRTLRPNTVFWHTSPDGRWKFVINANGFRNDLDIANEKPAGTVRVLSIGDSHTQGFEVHQDRTFSAVVERYLRDHGINAEVMNAGVSGFSNAEELIFLTEEGIKYSPDVVVLGFFSNDLDDNVKSGLFALEGGKLVVKKTEHIPGVRILNTINNIALLRWLGENSYLYSLALNTAWERAKRLLLSREEAELQAEYAIGSGDLGSYKLELASRILERMYAFCRENGIYLVVLDIPRVAGQSDIRSSVPPTLLDLFRNNSDVLVHAEETLVEYRGQAEFHRPHGHRHISEFTHDVLGREAGRYIVQMLEH